MRQLAALVGLALCLTTSLHAQETKSPHARGPIAESAEQIAREWWPTDAATFTIDEKGRPRFRSGVTETPPSSPWQPSSEAQPSRYRGAISHQEMLAVMTPREFSAPVISPSGASVDPGEIYQGIKQAWRDRQARRIHERVMRELEEFRSQGY
jgi:hypothetical protein